MPTKLIFTVFALFWSLISFGQDKIESNTLYYDPDKYKVIPDKVVEIGIPFLIIFLLLNTIVNILKNRAEHQLKVKMIEKGISETSLIAIFKESNAIAKLQPLKWFLFSLAMSISLLIIHFNKNYLINQSGYLAIGIILFFNSVAFLIYYYILAKKI